MNKKTKDRLFKMFVEEVLKDPRSLLPNPVILNKDSLKGIKMVKATHWLKSNGTLQDL